MSSEISPSEAVKLIQRSVAQRLLTDVQNLSDSMLGQPPQTLPTHLGHAIDMYMRARTLFKGCRLLIENDLPEEGMILCRSLFTESLRLSALASADEQDQIALVMGWRYSSLNEVRGLFMEAEKAGLEDDLPNALAGVERQRRSVGDYGRRNGVEKSKKFPDEKTMARAQGRDEDLWSFQLAHEMTHGSEAAHLQRRHKTAGVLAFFSGTSDSDFICGVARLAARSMVMAHYAAATILGWESDRDLEGWLAEIEHCTTVFEHEQGGAGSQSR